MAGEFFKNMPKGFMTNKKFAETNEHFQDCCIVAGVDPTTRQASKFRNKKGLAYGNKKHTVEKT